MGGVTEDKWAPLERVQRGIAIREMADAMQHLGPEGIEEALRAAFPDNSIGVWVAVPGPKSYEVKP